MKIDLTFYNLNNIADLFNVENMREVYPPPSAGDKQNQFFIFCELAIISLKLAFNTDNFIISLAATKLQKSLKNS
jgi:hypothetical protein